MKEPIDIFDGNHKHIGVLERSVVHQQGLWHQTFHCWFTGQRESSDFIVLQLRSSAKKSYPNMLDITAAGHLAVGEVPEDGIREIQEELGIDVNPSSLIRLGIKHDIADEPSGLRNREFAHVYLLREDRELTDYRLQEDEVSGLVRMKIQDGLRLFSGEVGSVQCEAVRVIKGSLQKFERDVSVADLIPRVDSYYLKVFYLASRFLAGDKYLAI